MCVGAGWGGMREKVWYCIILLYDIAWLDILLFYLLLYCILFVLSTYIYHSRADKKQKKILEDNYGKHDIAQVEKVKKLYNALDIENIYKAYEEESYQAIQVCIMMYFELCVLFYKLWYVLWCGMFVVYFVWLSMRIYADIYYVHTDILCVLSLYVDVFVCV